MRRMSTDRYRPSRSAYSSRSYGSMRQMSPPPSPPTSSRRGYLAAPLSTTSITLDQRFSSLKRARSVSPEPPPAPREDRLGPGSAKNQRYLAGLASRADIMAAVGDSEESNLSHSASTHDSADVHTDKLARARRIAAARAARNTKSRGDVHSRLGMRRGGGQVARGASRHFVRTSRRGQGQRGGRERSASARNGTKITVEALDSQLDEYMESAKKVGTSS